MYLLAFHCFLRIGEFTASKDKNCHLLSVQSVCFVIIKSNCPIRFELTMESFKHSKGLSHILYVECNKEDCTVCPVQALWTYFQVRKPSSGPLFTFMNRTPVSRKYFSDQLCLSLNRCGLDSNQNKGHSFRIGATTTAFTPLRKGYWSRKLKQLVDCHLMPLKSTFEFLFCRNQFNDHGDKSIWSEFKITILSCGMFATF